jgi:hypothetical protein
VTRPIDILNQTASPTGTAHTSFNITDSGTGFEQQLLHDLRGLRLEVDRG